ncbi:helix-turn-helix domain-containing protein [Nesterenkonia sp. HG001]|uniref:helix-turn-helix domain-containing protein n=1 Tax=Nesterenkonia sp. HG001 TaxID=2983207 RepID=UPI002AC6AC81|nr:helix-turn-helix domain-containing protein [Nesterenkonia sp. HG001]MDZ5076096.1 helix-turn-helix domain-containing protein [Nesterenkonia sp. HG001]
MALLERPRGRLTAKDFREVTPQRLRARQLVDAIDRDRLVVQLLDQGRTQTQAAEESGLSQATVHRISRRREQIEEQRENPRPMEVIARWLIGEVTHEAMIEDLVSRTYEAGRIPEGSYDGYVPGTWDDLIQASVNGMLPPEDFQQIRDNAAS